MMQHFTTLNFCFLCSFFLSYITYKNFTRTIHAVGEPGILTFSRIFVVSLAHMHPIFNYSSSLRSLPVAVAPNCVRSFIQELHIGGRLGRRQFTRARFSLLRKMDFLRVSSLSDEDRRARSTPVQHNCSVLHRFTRFFLSKQFHCTLH